MFKVPVTKVTCNFCTHTSQDEGNNGHILLLNQTQVNLQILLIYSHDHNGVPHRQVPVKSIVSSLAPEFYLSVQKTPNFWLLISSSQKRQVYCPNTA